MTTYMIDELAQFVDHTNLKANATAQEMETLCSEARAYHFKMVAINQVQSSRCSDWLEGSDIRVGAAIGFPLGQTSIAAKVFETQDAIASGATEIDYMINVTEVKEENWDYLKKEMTDIVAVCRQANVPCKVIFENAYLTEEEKVQLCKIAKEVQPDYIKTSTGFAPTGATVEDVRLMKQQVGEQVKVKAAGGIRDARTFKEMIANGAQRIGTSAGIAIIEELKKEAVDGKITIESVIS